MNPFLVVLGGISSNVWPHHAAVFGAKNEMHRSNSDYQSAPKTVERPQLILELRFNRAYQSRSDPFGTEGAAWLRL